MFNLNKLLTPKNCVSEGLFFQHRDKVVLYKVAIRIIIADRKGVRQPKECNEISYKDAEQMTYQSTFAFLWIGIFHCWKFRIRFNLQRKLSNETHTFKKQQRSNCFYSVWHINKFIPRNCYNIFCQNFNKIYRYLYFV